MADKEIELETFVPSDSLEESNEEVTPDLINTNLPHWISKFQTKVKYVTNLSLKYAWKKKISIILASLILILLIVLGFCLYRIDIGDNETVYVKNTIEFQIQDLGSVLKTWRNRTAINEEIIKTFNANSQLIQLDINKGEGMVRNEYSLSVHSCDINTFIRVREYLTGSEAGTSTLDIKGNSKLHWRACVYPYWPSFDKVSQSSQKCERDVHECDHKFSRESRIFFDEFKTFNVCADVFRYFPFAAGEKSLSTEIPIIHNNNEPWWIYRYKGSVGDSDYEVSFTLRYHEENDALYETNPPFDGEWSIRITTKGHGFDDHWDEEFKADVEHTYRALVDQFSYETCHFF